MRIHSASRRKTRFSRRLNRDGAETIGAVPIQLAPCRHDRLASHRPELWTAWSSSEPRGTACTSSSTLSYFLLPCAAVAGGSTQSLSQSLWLKKKGKRTTWLTKIVLSTRVTDGGWVKLANSPGNCELWQPKQRTFCLKVSSVVFERSGEPDGSWRLIVGTPAGEGSAAQRLPISS